jgi:hypothetical protein
MTVRFALLFPALALAACGGADVKGDPADERDPAVSAALSDPVLTDPDLTAQNDTGALTGGGPAVGEVPGEKSTPETIAASQEEAIKLAGGSLQTAPAPANVTGRSAPQTPVQLARLLPGKARDCADKLDYSAVWAAKLPDALQVYPRGHVQEAAGIDADGCQLRAVNFRTPVPVDDVVNFYYTRGRAGGYAAQHTLEGDDQVLRGSKGAAAYVLYVRKRANGLTEVDLATSGS